MQLARKFGENIGERGKVTWGELKKLVEQSGVTDHDEMDRIDIAWGNVDEIKISFDDDFGWQIYL